LLKNTPSRQPIQKITGNAVNQKYGVITLFLFGIFLKCPRIPVITAENSASQGERLAQKTRIYNPSAKSKTQKS